MDKIIGTNEAIQGTTVLESSYVICVGTSAGGLEALKLFFDGVPVDCKASIVVIQHLSPDHKSLMRELLAKETHLPILEVKDNMQIEPSKVYLIPATKNMTIKGDSLVLQNRPGNSELNLPIDIFMTSLARERGEKSIGVILTGSGSDGTRGARAIKEAGGLMLVQDPVEARFDSMPKSALSTGLIDFTLPAKVIARELFNFIRQAKVVGTRDLLIDNDGKMVDRLLNHLRNTTNLDFRRYKRPTLIRRIKRRMGVNKCNSLSEYLQFVYENHREVTALSKEFLIGVTSFFRDEEVWQTLEEKILPRLVAEKENNDTIKLWIVACSTGEEAYSIAILVHEELARQQKNCEVRIFATDLMKDFLEVGSKGYYPESIVADVSKERLSRYFVKNQEEYQIVDNIRRTVIFSHHNILEDPPFNRMDMVLCRNMLIYMDNDAQQKVLGVLHYALKENGFLLLGKSESVGVLEEALKEVNRKNRIYINTREAKSLVYHTGFKGNSIINLKERPRYRASNDHKMAQVMQEALAEELGLAAAFINDNFDLIQVIGKFRQFCEIPELGFSTNLLKLVSPKLSVAISSAVRKAAVQGKQVLFKEITSAQGDKTIQLNVIVRPFNMIGVTNRLNFLIILMPIDVRERHIEELFKNEVEAEDIRIKLLEEELRESRETLQSTIEEVETSNEELQSTNEELLAANEELQSTNEELQSVNEELHTVNTEFQLKLEEISMLNSELDNLMRSSEIGTIFLDLDLRVRRLTPAITKQFNLKDFDIGRPLLHFTSNFVVNDITRILAMVRDVIQTQNPSQSEVQSVDGRWYLQRITPYKTPEGLMDGTVLTYVDITELKRAQDEARQSDAKFKALFDQSPVGIAFVDNGGTFLLTNDRMVEVYGSESEVLVGATIFDKVHKDDRIDLRKAFERSRQSADAISEDFRVRKNDGAVHYLRLMATPNFDSGNKQKGFICSVEDITDVQLKEELMRQSEEKLRSVVEGNSASITLLDLEGTVLYVNHVYPWIKKADYIGSKIYEWLDQNSSTLVRKNIALVAGTQRSSTYELELANSESRKAHFVHSMSPMYDGSKVIGVSLISNEVTAIKELEENYQRAQYYIDRVPDAVFWTDENGEIIYLNQSCVDLLGYPEDELLGKSIADINPILVEGNWTSLWKQMHKEEAMLVETELKTKSGEVIPIEVALSHASFDGVNHNIVVARDIQERKKTEHERKQRAELERINKELEQFAYIASHDLQEPLRTIESFTRLLSEDYTSKLDEKGKKHMRFITNATGRMSKLIEGILGYSRLGRNRIVEEIDTNELVASIISDFDNTIQLNHAVIEVKDLPSVYGSEAEIRILFQNLISNGIKFRSADEKPVVKISAQVNDHSKEFVVEDNGIGIDEKYHDKIFVIFQRLHNQNEFEGTGIGLAHCKRIVDLHGGEIWVEPNAKQGSKFLFTIPNLKNL